MSKSARNQWQQIFLPLLMRLTKVNHLLNIHDQYANLHSVAFASSILEHFNIDLEYTREDLEHIPTDQQFIVIANHPSGLLDGLALITVLAKRTDNFSLVVNYLLEQLSALDQHFTYVDPFPNSNSPKRFAGVKELFRDIKAGKSLVFFPAGDVSYFHFSQGEITDPEWNDTCIKLIQKMRLPIIPIFIHLQNSLSYQICNTIHPKLALACLPRELLNKASSNVKLSIGQAFRLENNTASDLQTVKKTLRQKVYSLGINRPVAS